MCICKFLMTHFNLVCKSNATSWLCLQYTPSWWFYYEGVDKDLRMTVMRGAQKKKCFEHVIVNYLYMSICVYIHFYFKTKHELCWILHFKDTCYVWSKIIITQHIKKSEGQFFDWWSVGGKSGVKVLKLHPLIMLMAELK